MSAAERRSRRGSGHAKGPQDKASRLDPAAERVERAPGTPPKRTLPQEQQEEARPTKAGYRSSRRTSKGGKQLRRQAKAERVREEVGATTDAVTSGVVRVLKVGGGALISVALVVGLVWGAAIGVNALARWNARRVALANAAKATSELGRENLLVIGVKDKEAVGLAALKAEREGERVLGIAIPDGAFVEVPGQGFESIGDSFHVGPDVSMDAVSNFLMVPFQRYVTVDADVYQRMLTQQDVAGLLDRTLETNLTAEESEDLKTFFTKVPTKDVWIVPMPVKAVTVGTERYFEPQRGEIADLVLQWWGVRVEQQKQALRVMLYNGVGTPGVAGKAAQQLIRLGVRVVDSKNADNFDYKQTKILLYHGTQADALRVKDALGVGQIAVESDVQDLADVIVIIGADYTPPGTP
ncbi:MAG: LytR C-terminal domain-containing protein [Coriobacteriia bacterium]|nr:LytR C-terminal domain-containing protein [Coriobacteriia bacterium]